MSDSNSKVSRYIIWVMLEFPVDQLRVLFPALRDEFIFFDNAAGAQSPATVLDAVAHHLLIAMFKEEDDTASRRK